MDIQTIAEYDATAKARCAQYETVDFRWLYDALTERLQPGSTILEIGCGSGRDARALAERGYLVTATDASSGMLVEAQRLSSGDNPRFAHKAFPLASADSLLQQSFDAILAIAVLMHIPHSERHTFFAQVSRLLKPDGLFMGAWSNNRVDKKRLFVNLMEDDIRSYAQISNMLLLEITHSQDALGRKINWITCLLKNTTVS